MKAVHCTLAIPAFVLLPLLAADTVLLNGGATLEGQLIKDAPHEADVVLCTGAKNVTLKRSDIKEVRLDQAARAEFQKRLDQLQDNDANGHFQLAQWAKQQRMYALAEAGLHATIAADPKHEQARKALGHVYQDGRWLALTEITEDSGGAIASAESSDDGDLTITANPNVPTIWRSRLLAYESAMEVSRQFADSGDDKQRQQALTQLIKRDKNRAIEALLGCADFATTTDQKLRTGAIKALDAGKLAHPVVSTYLARSVVADPAPDVRAQAVESIKARKDDTAMGKIIDYLMTSYDKNGGVLDQNRHDNAVRALKNINDKRVIQTLLYYVTMEIRATHTDLTNFATRQIDSYSVNNGATATVIMPLSFPIQFPELKITKVRSSVKCPAVNALADLTGENFGMDVERWGKWIEKH